ncbi:hypothetical protein [Demequina pelophila]|uniref:hypothetical protein n=1 Tax=Demequina pelophila TaxID=1638984 RepID=UPI00078227A1|nr:hypothetical protein [Demequina pelophila]
MARKTGKRFTPPAMPAPGPMATPRQQWTGAIVIAAMALLLTVGASWVAGEVSGRHVEAGGTVTVGDAMELTVAEGWSLSAGSGDLLTILENGDATYTAVTPSAYDPERTPEDQAASQAELLENSGWDVEVEETVTTDQGYTALSYTGTGPDGVQRGWVVSDGESVASSVLEMPAADDAVVATAEQMVMSLVFLEASS